MRGRRLGMGLLGLLVAGGCSAGHGGSTASTPAASEVADAGGRRCEDRNPQRNAYFGELHVHTIHSMDAYTWDVRVTPDANRVFTKSWI